MNCGYIRMSENPSEQWNAESVCVMECMECLLCDRGLLCLCMSICVCDFVYVCVCVLYFINPGHCRGLQVSTPVLVYAG